MAPIRTERGLDRLVNFSDATVAIAITLLILPLVDAASRIGSQSFADFKRDPAAHFKAFFANLPDGPPLDHATPVSDLIGMLELPNQLRPGAYEGMALIGDAALCARYRHAATLFGWPPVDTIDGAAAAGLWVLAERAGLLAAASEGAAVRLDEPAAALGGRHDDRQAVDPVPDNACNISGDSR